MGKEEKYNKKRKLSVSLSETEEIIGRLKEALSVKSDGELANNLGISRQNLGAARKRDDVPPGWVYKVAELSGWIGFVLDMARKYVWNIPPKGRSQRVSYPVRRHLINFR